MLNFYVYADGSDLDQCEPALIKAFSSFASSQTIATSVVNDRKLRTPDLKDEDLPDWNLGLNFSVPSLGEVFSEDLISFLSKLSHETDRDFVIGLWNENSQFIEDLMFVGSESPSSKGAELRQIVNGR